MRVYPQDGFASAIRITRSTIVAITRRRPGAGRRLYVHLRAIRCRYQHNRCPVRPECQARSTACARARAPFAASLQRSASVKRRCLPPRRASIAASESSRTPRHQAGDYRLGAAFLPVRVERNRRRVTWAYSAAFHRPETGRVRILGPHGLPRTERLAAEKRRDQDGRDVYRKATCAVPRRGLPVGANPTPRMPYGHSGRKQLLTVIDSKGRTNMSRGLDRPLAERPICQCQSARMALECNATDPEHFG